MALIHTLFSAEMVRWAKKYTETKKEEREREAPLAALDS